MLAATTPIFAQPPSLRVGIYDMAPLSSISSEGEYSGFFVEILDHIASREGWSLNYTQGSLAELMEQLRSGDLDIVAAVPFEDKADPSFVLNNETVISTWARIYARPGVRVESILDLQGMKVGVVRDDPYNSALRSLMRQLDAECVFVEFKNYDHMLEGFENKWIDAGAMERAFGNNHTQSGTIQTTSIILSPISMRFAVAASVSPDVTEAIDYHLTNMKADMNSVYYAVLNSVFGQSRPSAAMKFLSYGLLAALGLLLGLGGFSVFLRKQVEQKTSELSRKNDVLSREIEARRRVEKDLRDSESRYRSFMSNFRGVVFRCDTEYRPEFFHGAVEDITGHSQEDFNSGDVMWHSIIHPEDTHKLALSAEKAKTVPGFFEEREYRIVRKDGEVRWVSELIQNMCNGDSKPSKIEGTIYDITDRKLLEQEILHAQKMEAVGTLAGGIAHDFNNLLHIIVGYSELLCDGSGSEESKHAAGQVLRAAQRGSELTRQLLMFSRKEKSAATIFDLNELISKQHSLLERTIPKMIAIELRLGRSVPTVKGDPVQFEQVLMNLAVNAKDAMPKGGRITVETTSFCADREFSSSHPEVKPGQYAQLVFSDTGTGMDPHTIKHIFDPFFTTKPPGEGTGLGLSVLYGIVKSHGGFVTCYSEKDVGTTFKLYFPAVQTAGDSETQESADISDAVSVEAKPGERVLIVDDDAAVRLLGARLLSKRGYDVVQAGRGEKALDIYRKEGENIDLVILDLIMPGIGGAQCLRKLIEFDPLAKVVVASGYSIDMSSRQAIESGAKGFVSKPYNGNEMLKTIRRVLDAKA